MTVRSVIFGFPQMCCTFSIVLAAILCHANAASSEQLEKIFLRLYNGTTLDQYSDKFLGEATDLLPQIDIKKPTVIFIYGYTGTLEKEAVVVIVNAFLQRGDHNIIVVDWEEIAGQNYISVAASASGVGEAIAKAIEKMVEKGLNNSTLHLVGHSMGAQVCGFVGRKLNFTLPRITGLDPAGPGFTVLINHLQSTDAKFVDIIHTDQRYYGNSNTGSVDFYPNGGSRIQPGCPIFYAPFSDEGFCSHHRAYILYAESVVKENALVAVKCDSYEKFKRNDCRSDEKIIMGYGTPKDAKGYFYLQTNDKSPYGRRGVGTKYEKPGKHKNNTAKV